MTTDPGDLVLDPTCGSGTTGYVAEQWGRRWIMIDTSRVAMALARTRLMAARYSYCYLADTPQGRRKEAEVSGKVLPDIPTYGDIRHGFVYDDDLMFPYPDRSLRLLTERCQEHRLKGVP
jgi:adenine-specific DNA-methyltransferase